MPLVDMHDMLQHAHSNSYAVGGFDVVSLDFIDAIIAASEHCRAPVILSLAESHFEYYDFELAMAACEVAARRANIPVAIHLDHGASYDSARRAINLGCNGVMVDASHTDFPTNVELTRKVVEMAHRCGVAVEGELGYVAGVEGEDAEKHPGEIVYTSVEEARVYVERTKVDCLAVSIGTVHGRLRGRPKLDCERLKRIHEAVDIPLVIHGGTGLSDDQFRRLISLGVAKINYYTALSDAAADVIRVNSRSNNTAGYTALLKDVREAIATEVERCQRVFGAAGRAAEVLAQCRVWHPIEHVIFYNVENASEDDIEAMMARGREVLRKIPGVRRVITGWPMLENQKFRFCWIVEFVHESVIANYRDHPEHAAFANGMFRPMAGDRLSLDFADVSRLSVVNAANGVRRAQAV
jgi:fructose-bisphosphate aldolase class II